MKALPPQICLVTGLLLPLIAGCSDEQSGQKTAEKPVSVKQAVEIQQPMRQEFDPCALITQAKMEEIIGVKVTAPTATIDRVEGVTFLNCTSNDIHINIESWEAESQAIESYDFGTKFPSIEGLGDKARNTQPLGEVDVLYGRYIVSVDLFTGLDRKAELEAATTIARTVLENIPK
ncbi:MAG: DUF3558 domain-containing protein [Candidatus Thiodiazotropha sp. (ex Ctena orbiculata)]|nr:DUF3558 domain-containing protein [Candidatus Thiodiazotropha taylori]PVV16131.1 MAG: hypothetical protein B6D82_01810 [gamma proteobacterium symbiont of Ctena orbiculata]MBT2998461.1 DUF3558 domain-containing protein [Candidatus Thiodiazotropha taylori]MBT3002639.1 DUF3558 domain-containing protein [Candidatus Thiodiazotropha taylori]MBV2109082.1 DUF3558 domain-containing protein [Candidatus Thiodiazotropha taylori]